MAEISIIIVNWNTVQLLQKSLQSIEGLKSSLSIETIVVDNGSSDESVALVKEKFPKVLLIANSKNEGFATAVNQGLQKSQGQSILLLNSDAQLVEGTLEKLKKVLDSEPKIGMVGADLVYEDGRHQNSIDHFPNLATELFNKSVLKLFFSKWYPGKRSGFDQPIKVPSLIGAGLFLKRKMVEEIGLLDEGYFFFLEETDWCYRMRQQGWTSFFVPEAKIIHLQGQSAKKHPWRSRVEFYRSRYRFFRKNYGFFSYLILLVGLNIRILLELLFTGLVVLLSLGFWRDGRKRFSRYAALLGWHLMGCPKKMGLSVL